MTLTRRHTLSLLAGALVPTRARAQIFPTRPVTIVVPYPAGGPTDAIARIVAQELAPALGQSVIVRNEAGASGAVGTRSVARAEPDGHTIVFGNNQTHGNNMFLLKELGYDAVADFAPLAGVGAFEHVFVVRKDLFAITINDLVEMARKEPGKLNYGSTGIGSGSHLATELFMTRTGIRMTHVPFRGAAPLVQELMGGRIDVSNSTLPSVLGQIRDTAGRADTARAGYRQRRCRIVGRVLRACRDAVHHPRAVEPRDHRAFRKAYGRAGHHQDGLQPQGARPGRLPPLPCAGDQDLGRDHQGRRRQAGRVTVVVIGRSVAFVVQPLIRVTCQVVWKVAAARHLR